MIYPVILSGGSGSRLWPLSRASLPKQLLPLLTDEPMIVETAKRFVGAEFAAPTVICNAEHRFLIAASLQMAGIKPLAILLEPEARNTAPAITTAASFLAARDPDAVLLVMPSDHRIDDVPALHRALAPAVKAAESGYLVTFGVVPNRPEIGYGYIRVGEVLAEIPPLRQVSRFVEKPDLERAERYLAEGGHLWNAGLFAFRADRFLNAINNYEPAVHAACTTAVKNAVRDYDFIRINAEVFSTSPSVSVDVAVMERADNVAVMPIDVGWSDVGTWQSLWELGEKDASGNVLQGDSLALESERIYMRAGAGTLAAAIGVKDLVIVASDNALLVMDRRRSDQVKTVVSLLEAKQRDEHINSTTVYRPWGTFRIVDAGDRFKVKRIVVNPGAALSMQYHHKRAEHWIVVQGTARVTRGEEVFLLGPNESTYIPIGASHRLENVADEPLHLIEVQSGSYLGEDDIVRLEDRYGRSQLPEHSGS